MTQHKIIAAVIVGFCAFINSLGAHADSKSEARLGLKTWAAFACSTFAAHSGQKEEGERLFKVGYESGKRLLNAINTGEISNKDAESELPVGILFVLQGPNVDFILGRIYAASSDDAYDRIVKYDDSGIPINDPARWIIDKTLIHLRSERKYRESNCRLL